MVQSMERKYQLLDPESIIECPICNKLLCPPVYQCMNGHIVCAACREKLRANGCAYCRSKPIAHSRCLAVEKLMESVVTSCRYAPEGCQEMLKLPQKEQHETELCEHRPHKQNPPQEPITLLNLVHMGGSKWAQLTPRQRQERLLEIKQRHLQRVEQLQQQQEQHQRPQQEAAIDPGLQGQRRRSRMSEGPASLAALHPWLQPRFSTPQQFHRLCFLYHMCQERDSTWEQFYLRIRVVFWDELQVETIVQILQNMVHWSNHNIQ